MLPDGGRARVLIVDDKRDIRSLLAARLGLDPGLEVVGEAANGMEAIARARELQPEVVVLDLQMPVMSGQEVIPVLHSLRPGARIVVYSAFVGVQGQLEPNGGADVEVAKGTDLKVLVAEIHRVLAAPLEDLVRVELGQFEVDQAGEACGRWNQLSQQVHGAAPADRAADLRALVGVLVAIGERLAAASSEGRTALALDFTTRAETAVAAHRALLALDGATAAALEPLRGPLVAGLAVAHPAPAPAGARGPGVEAAS
jgi:CheY-like chemotaxis protein